MTLDELFEQSRRSHVECPDSWYSCPLSTSGCSNYANVKTCDCGAEYANEVIDQIKELSTKMLELLGRISSETAFTGLPDILQEEVFEIISKVTGDAELRD